MDSDTFSSRRDGTRLSSSPFSRQGWSRLSPSYAPPPSDAGPSHHANWRRHEYALDESDLAQRSTALHQVSGASRSWSRTDQPTSPNTSRQPAPVPTRPVLVRAYSGNAEGSTNKLSTMSPRRLFPFIGLKSPASSRPARPPLPSDKDFSIEHILQAIEPDIRGTLDSIAEICGRSKLSLANEYGSHIAPLGEIRAPPTGLGPVEEASSTDERRDEGVVIFDDDPSIMDAGRDMHPFSFYRYLENLRQAASALERNSASGPSGSAQPSSATPAILNNAQGHDTVMEVSTLPTTREFVSRPKHSGRDLLAKPVASGGSDALVQDISTPAVVSEIHLEARGNEHNTFGEQEDRFMTPAAAHSTQDVWQAPDVLCSLVGWLKWTARLAGPGDEPVLKSAESRLRAMLQQSAAEGTI
ncbi:uncharacterized protein N7483_000899 [Penicillium malachiteum]|uniref:uncharacterized protein n=1 Tax=Penicillium malachiteum TaxID=1324776 RepID=UPI0025493A95|nr:uncharacterized protein N7483_000899 [Penicillium malachiteum]KAJ5735774.1 hypothetical protein N7483_000899 [Penicillium malachiteum]